MCARRLSTLRLRWKICLSWPGNPCHLYFSTLTTYRVDQKNNDPLFLDICRTSQFRRLHILIIRLFGSIIASRRTINHRPEASRRQTTPLSLFPQRESARLPFSHVNYPNCFINYIEHKHPSSDFIRLPIHQFHSREERKQAERK